jgi:hypothetical protein
MTNYMATYGGKLSFWWKVSSESGYDKLKFSISTDGGTTWTQIAEISGEQDWAKFETELTPATNYYFKWEYIKDSSVSTGSDKGWIDDFMILNEGTDIYCMQYDYDTNGRKIRQVIKTGESDPDTSAYYVTTFNYDSRDMLVEEKYLRWDGENDEWMVMYWARYKYDTAGNMVWRDVEQIVNGNVKHYSDGFAYSRGYQLMEIIRTAVGEGVVTSTLSYDENGNLTHIEQDGAFVDSFYDITEMEFQFDLKNRLIKYRFGGEGYWNEIKYDALGRVRERLSADETPITKKFYSDGRQLIQQLEDGNNAEFDYLRGPTGLDRQWNEATDKRYFYIKDPLGTVWAMIESGFTPQQSPLIRLYNYNAWGEHIDASDINFPDYDDDPNLMRYIGCRVEAFGKGTTTQRDAIYHLDYRHYLPFTCSFASMDPLKLIQLYRYSPYYYAYNFPTAFSDYSGLSPRCGGCSSEPGIIDPKAPFTPEGYEVPLTGWPDWLPTEGEGDCCILRAQRWWRWGLNLYGTPLAFLRAWTSYPGDIWPVIFDPPIIAGFGKVTCNFRVWVTFLYYSCYYAPDYNIFVKLFWDPCPEEKVGPCYTGVGSFYKLAEWVGTKNLGPESYLIWRNKEHNLITRTYIRIELLNCGPIDNNGGPIGQWLYDLLLSNLGFTRIAPGGVGEKNFCIQDQCICAKSYGLELGRALVKEKGPSDLHKGLLNPWSPQAPGEGPYPFSAGGSGLLSY